jgi:hypothetical protein
MGCVGEVNSTITTKSSQQQALWQCDIESTNVACQAPMPGQAGEPGAYACDANDARAVCPPASIVDATPGLNDLVLKYQASTTFKALPWACLLTGRDQRTCVRDVRTGTPSAPGQQPSTPNEPTQPQMPSDPTQPSNTTPPAQAQVAQPAPPTSCDATAWEPYFANLATFEYQTHGVKITFPRSLFNSGADFQSLATEAGQLPANPGAPSCQQGEGDMRQQAWLDAVMDGCSNLNSAILVMCQQAANYAPQQGACAPTGTW